MEYEKIQNKATGSYSNVTNNIENDNMRNSMHYYNNNYFKSLPYRNYFNFPLNPYRFPAYNHYNYYLCNERYPIYPYDNSIRNQWNASALSWNQPNYFRPRNSPRVPKFNNGNTVKNQKGQENVKRFRFSHQQTLTLLKVYEKCRYPEQLDRLKLAKLFNTTVGRINIWFQNKRGRERKRIVLASKQSESSSKIYNENSKNN